MEAVSYTHLEMRMHTGEPYLVFTDTANRALPSWLKDKGLSIHGSNLCTEIFLPTSKDRTAVCCLSSVNLEYYDEWRGNEQFIDCLLYTSLRGGGFACLRDAVV